MTAVLVAVELTATSGTAVAATGPGAVTVRPAAVTAGAAVRLAITYKAPSSRRGFIGRVSITLPVGWTKPQTATHSAAGYLTIPRSGKARCDARIVAVHGHGDGPWSVTVAATCRSGSSFTVTYAHASSPRHSGTYTFQAASKRDHGVGFRPLSHQPSVLVRPASANSLSVTGIPSSVKAGDALSVRVTASDAFGNPATGYGGTVHFTSSDAEASLPPDSRLTAGAGTFAITFGSAGTQSVTATDTLSPGLSATETGISVAPACAAAPTIDAIDAAVTPNSNDGGLAPATPGSKFFRDDGVTLSATPSSTCAHAGPFHYAWTLTRPAGSAAVLSSPTADAPSFTADIAGGEWRVSLVVTDQYGIASQAVTKTFSADQCGAFPITVGPIGDQAAGHAFDIHTLSATASSSDDDPSRCPSRFHNSYSYQWSLQNPPSSNSSLTGATTSSATFAAGDTGSWTVHVQATPSASASTPGTASTTITAACSPTPVLTASTTSGASSPHVGTTSGDFNRDDMISLHATPDVSSCYSNPADAQLTYSWSLTPAPGDNGSAPALSSPTATTPSFTVDRPGEALSAGVTVTDKWGHSNDNSTQFTASSCGASPISVSQISDQTDGKAFDPHALSTTASSVDDDPAKCPSRFANTYSYQWSLQNPPSSHSSLTGATTSSATFSAGDNGTWTIQVAATPSMSSSAPGTSSIGFVESCSTSPVVSAPFVLSGDLLVGDTATLATTVDVSACYTHASDAGLTYFWGLNLTSGPGSAPTLSGATTATPSFTVSTSGQTLHATVGAMDKWGHTGGNGQDFTTS